MLENEDIDLLSDILESYIAEEDIEDEKILKLNLKIHLINDQIKIQSEAQLKIQKIHEEMKNL